jgi:hypothetical protein
MSVDNVPLKAKAEIVRREMEKGQLRSLFGSFRGIDFEKDKTAATNMVNSVKIYLRHLYDEFISSGKHKSQLNKGAAKEFYDFLHKKNIENCQALKAFRNKYPDF